MKNWLPHPFFSSPEILTCVAEFFLLAPCDAFLSYSLLPCLSFIFAPPSLLLVLWLLDSGSVLYLVHTFLGCGTTHFNNGDILTIVQHDLSCIFCLVFCHVFMSLLEPYFNAVIVID